MVAAIVPAFDALRLATLGGLNRWLGRALSSALENFCSSVFFCRCAHALSNLVSGATYRSFPVTVEDTIALRNAILLCLNVIVLAGSNGRNRQASGGGGLEGEKKGGDDVDFHCEYSAYFDL